MPRNEGEVRVPESHVRRTCGNGENVHEQREVQSVAGDDGENPWRKDGRAEAVDHPGMDPDHRKEHVERTRIQVHLRKKAARGSVRKTKQYIAAVIISLLGRGG